jgi:hypothetical protein
MLLSRLCKDAEGATMVEFTVILFFLFLLLGGLVDFMYIFWQRNMLVKAVERGARIAAVSNSVAGGPSGLDGFSTPGGCTPGDLYPPAAYDCVCNGATGACTAGANGPCGLAYNTAAMNTIVYGRGGSAATCRAAGKNTYTIGMCDLATTLTATGDVTPLTPANVIVEYSDTGLGFCGRPGGPVPTIDVQLQNVKLNYFFLAGFFFNVTSLNLPTTVKSSITGEDLCFSLSCP